MNAWHKLSITEAASLWGIDAGQGFTIKAISSQVRQTFYAPHFQG
jgi:hypothetical protein